MIVYCFNIYLELRFQGQALRNIKLSKIYLLKDLTNRRFLLINLAVFDMFLNRLNVFHN